jgi:molybdate-binding protein
MISAAGLDRSCMRGYESEEITHAAVAAMIAGHQADAGFGIQPAATQYHLDFVPICAERYFLACRADDLDSPPVAQLLGELRGPRMHEVVAALPGYSAPDAGAILAAIDTGATPAKALAR